MGSLQERIAAYADASADLVTQLHELDELRERLRKAQLFAHLCPKALRGKEGPPASRKASARSA
jgi:hypothetical protein